MEGERKRIRYTSSDDELISYSSLDISSYLSQPPTQIPTPTQYNQCQNSECQNSQCQNSEFDESSSVEENSVSPMDENSCSSMDENSAFSMDENSVSSMSSSSVEENTQNTQNAKIFIPSLIEKQVIRQGMAAICRTNMSDWNCEISDVPKLFLRQPAIIFKSTGDAVLCDIIISLYNRDIYTICEIHCNFPGEKNTCVIYTEWLTEYIGDYEEYDTINIYKYVDETSFFVFVNTVKYQNFYQPRDCSEHSWCFFSDARNHVNRISL